MADRVERAGLRVDADLARFIEQQVIAPIGISADDFWAGFAALLDTFVPRNRALLARRDELQAQIDAWHISRAGKVIDQGEYQAFLKEIGYLVPEPGDFAVATQNVDSEIASMAGPQLVVPVLNARFLLNAANARWGSLYDALYGTDALDAPPAKPGGYDPERGAAVVARVRQFLDDNLPGWEAALTGGDCPHPYATKDGGVMFVKNKLHVELVIDRDHPVGKDDPFGIADVILESALTTIVDLEDSVAAVDAEELVDALRDNCVDDRVGNEFAGVHNGLGALADFGARADGRAQHVTGRELRNAMPLDQPLRLRPLPSARRSEQYKSHRPLLPPRSFDFLISPSYWCAIRCPCTCATVSSVTLTTISNDVPPR